MGKAGPRNRMWESGVGWVAGELRLPKHNMELQKRYMTREGC